MENNGISYEEEYESSIIDDEQQRFKYIEL